MQDVTDLEFWRVIHHYGGPDLYYTEYFRTHRDSKPEKYILRSIDQNPTGKPVIAQMIGEDIPSLIRTAISLQKHNVLGIDLNLGCPAPIVCRKSAGGGLLKTPGKIHEILTALRDSVSTNFTVKTRIGFDSSDEFPGLLEVFSRHSLDALTIHGRTVRQLYRDDIDSMAIASAVKQVAYPVFANGNMTSALKARFVSDKTSAQGLMIGRGAIRNPWIFRQIDELYRGEVKTRPALTDLRTYIDRLYRETFLPGTKEQHHIAKMKKYMNFIAPGVGGNDDFLVQIRRCTSEREFFHICDAHLLKDSLFDPIEPSMPIQDRNLPYLQGFSATS